MLPQFAALEVVDADKVRVLRNGLQRGRNTKAGLQHSRGEMRRKVRVTRPLRVDRSERRPLIKGPRVAGIAIPPRHKCRGISQRSIDERTSYTENFKL